MAQKANHKLRALLSTSQTSEVNKIASNTAKKFCESRNFGAMDLSRSIFDTPFSGLLHQTGVLQHLTCFSVSNTRPLVQLPPSLDKLSNLRVLDVSYCQNLKILPPPLLYYDFQEVKGLRCQPLWFTQVLGRLSNLEVLLGFKPAKSIQLEGCGIGELRNLVRLRTLGIRLSCCDEIGDTEVNVLVNLQELQHLSISCFDSHGNNDRTAKLDQLLPPQQLHELSLEFYPGKISAAWLNPISLPILRYLSISSGNLAKMNEKFWGNDNIVWKIEGLLLQSLSNFEE